MKLGLLADIQTGPFGSLLHREDYVNYGTPIITVEHLVNNFISHEDVPMVSDSDKERLSRFVLRKGDIVFSRVGSVDRLAAVRDEEEGWLFSGRCLRVRVTSENVDPSFLFYYMSQAAFKERVRSIAVGATMPSINTRLLSDMEIDIPSISIQRSIATILSSLDNKLELNNRINKTLEEMAQVIFKRWFVDFEFPDENGSPYKSAGGEMVESEMGAIPRGWRIGAFTEVVDVLGGGTPKTGVPDYWDGEIPFFTPKDCSGSYYVLDTEKHITVGGLAACNSKLYPENMVFITARGTVGKVALAGCKMAMNQSCYALQGKSGYKQFFVHQLTLYVVDILKNHANGAVFDAIVTRDFDTAIIVIPEQSIADKYNNTIYALYSKLLLIDKENRKLQITRDALLPKLINGELGDIDNE